MEGLGVIGSKADNSIPVCYVHVDALKLRRQEGAVMRYEVPHLLQLVHALFEPVL